MARALAWPNASESRLPGSVAPGEMRLRGPHIPATLADSLFAATLREEATPATSGTPVVRRETLRASRWLAPIHDFDLLMEVLGAPAWENV